MTHRQRILADKIIGAPLGVVFNFLARALGLVMRRNHTMSPENVRRIIVAKLVGMGSILQATPLLRSLKMAYPEASITFVTLRSNRGLVERLEGVDEVLCLDDSTFLRMAWTTLGTLATLIRRRADIYFDLELYSAFASLMALWAVTRNRVGFYRRSTTLKNGIYTHLVYFNARMPIRQLFLQLGRVVGAPHPTPDFVGPIRMTPADDVALAAKLGSVVGFVPGTPYVVINPNASDLLLERRWPTAYVVKAVERLAAAGRTLVFIGAPSERAYVASVLAQLSEGARARTFSTAGLLSLTELFALLRGAACVLTNDTGPMHMAIALGAPTVCLFGPVHPDHYGHVSERVITLYAPVFCSPCVHEIAAPPCNGDNVCMQRLAPELAVDAVERLLAGETSVGRSVRLATVTDDARDRPLGLVVRASMRTMGG